jgi:predicted nuclease with TOPRIM domain
MTTPDDLTTRTRQELDRLASLATDAFYIGVGAGVLAFQKLQVHRNELQRDLAGRVEERRELLDELAKRMEASVGAFEARLVATEARVDSLVDQARTRLPDPAADLVGQAHEATKTARTHLRTVSSSLRNAAPGRSAA